MIRTLDRGTAFLASCKDGRLKAWALGSDLPLLDADLSLLFGPLESYSTLLWTASKGGSYPYSKDKMCKILVWK